MSTAQQPAGSGGGNVWKVALVLAVFAFLGFVVVPRITDWRSSNPVVDRVVARVQAAGWTNQDITVGTVSKTDKHLLTNPLPIEGGCTVQLKFSPTGEGPYIVAAYYRADGGAFYTTGDDHQQYPEVFNTKFHNPTLAQINAQQKTGGLTKYCASSGTPG